MKQNNLLTTMLLLFAVIVGSTSVWAEEITFPSSDSNVSYTNSGISVSGTDVSVSIAKGDGSNLATNTDGTRVYVGNTIEFSSSTKKIAKIEFAYKRNRKITNGISANVGSFTTAFTVGNSTTSNLSAIWEASDETTTVVIFTVGSGSGNYALQSAVVTFVDEGGGSTTPSINVENVTLDYNAPNGEIEYSISNYAAGTMQASTTANWISDFYYDYDEDSNYGVVGFETTANTAAAARTATVTLTYTYGDSETATQDVTITQAGDPDAEGGLNNPYTVPQAIANIGVNGVYVTGIVTEIETAYNAQSGTISYYISNGTPNAAQLLVNQGKSYDGANFTSSDAIQVEDEVVVCGNLDIYGGGNAIAAGNKLVSLKRPAVSADDVDIAYNVTNGSIAYTITNGVVSGALSASVPDGSWVTLGDIISNSVPFTCETNPALTARTATVTLTYTYGNSDKTQTKEVTITQAGNPNAVNNISDITAAGTYTVKGTIVAKSTRGFIVGDGTGYVYYYNQNYTQANYNIGDMVKLDGSVVAYGGVFEFNSSTTITAASESNYVAEEPTILTGSDMDTRVASTTNQLSTYVQYEGTLTVSGTYYNITNIDGASTAKGSISYPISTDFTSLSGKTVKVKGYYVGVSSSTYYNTMIGSIEEVVDITPSISVESATLDIEPEGEIGSLYISYNNITISGANDFMIQCCDGNGDETTQPTWISTLEVIYDNDSHRYKVHYDVEENTGAARSAYFKVVALGSTDYVYSNLVTINQAAALAPLTLDKAYVVSDWVNNFDGSYITSETEKTINGVTFKVNQVCRQNDLQLKANAGEMTSQVINSANGYSVTIVTGSGSNSTGELTVQIGDETAQTVTGANKTLTVTTTNTSTKFTIKNLHAGAMKIASITIIPIIDAPEVQSYGWATYIAAQNVEFADGDAYVVTEVNTTTGAVTVAPVESAPANTPILLKGEGTKTMAVLTDAPAAPSTNMLSVSDGTANGSKVPYVLAKNDEGAGFKQWTGDISVLNGRVVMWLDSAIATARSFFALDGEEATGINEMQAMKTVENEKFYNLAGQRIAQPTKGLYIVNGKKYIVK